MAQVSPFLRSFAWKESGLEGFSHYCPGCDGMHIIYTKRKDGGWSFDGNLNKPTFNPSVRIYYPAHKDKEGRDIPEHTTCHYFLHAGVLKFCDDSDHELKGKEVPLPELPADYQNDGWADGE